MIITVLKAVFWGALLLSLLVFVHEGGHYLLARASGMRVTEFFIGMPCKKNISFRSKTRGTKFGITPILVGGYTRICGMEGLPTDYCAQILGYLAAHGVASADEIARELDVPVDDVANDLAVLVDWASIEEVTADTADSSNPYYDADALGDDDYLYTTVARDPELRTLYDKGHDLALEGSTVAGEPHPLTPASTAQNKVGAALVPIQRQAKDFYEAEKAATYLGKGFLPRVAALIAGPAVNIVLGLLSVALVLSISGVQTVVNTSTISAVTEGSIADQIGMQAGDTILSIAGTKLETWSDFTVALADAKELTEPFEVTFSHEGSDEVLSGMVDPAQLNSEGMFGVYATTELYHPAIITSLGVAWSYVVATAEYVVQLFMPQYTQEIISNSSSVVGISVMASEAAESGLADFIYLMAAVSLSLGFMNLIPIPPLDGGKLLIEIVGLVIRRPVPLKVQEALSIAGLFLFMGLFVVALHQDILRFVLGG